MEEEEEESRSGRREEAKRRRSKRKGWKDGRDVSSYGSPQLFSALFNFMHNGSVLAGTALFFIYLFILCLREVLTSSKS